MLLLLLLPPTIIAGDDDASGAAFVRLPSLTINPIPVKILSMSIAEIAKEIITFLALPSKVFSFGIRC
jgi:hypothetical protein